MKISPNPSLPKRGIIKSPFRKAGAIVFPLEKGMDYIISPFRKGG
jgi:hypothetical protein